MTSPTRTVSLPADDGFLLDQPTQWWYWTGHLATADGRRFGFEFCWFAFHADVLLGKWINDHLGHEGFIDRVTHYAGFQMVNVALTDVAGQTYSTKTYFGVGHPKQLTGAFDFSSQWPHRGAITASGGSGSDALHVSVPDWGYELTLVNDNAAHPPVLQYGGDMHKYVFGGYTYYYSRPFMQAAGTVRVDGHSLPVTGTAWFDRQFGELNQAVICGWQWFAMQFDDGRQTMVFALTDEPAEQYASTSRGNDFRMFSPEDVEVTALAHWTSPATGIVYPAGWQVRVADEIVIVRPSVANQEMREPAPWPAYWEGDSIILSLDDHQIGLAYVELSGFKKPGRPGA